MSYFIPMKSFPGENNAAFPNSNLSIVHFHQEKCLPFRDIEESSVLDTGKK